MKNKIFSLEFTAATHVSSQGFFCLVGCESHIMCFVILSNGYGSIGVHRTLRRGGRCLVGHIYDQLLDGIISHQG